jgi:hypothetical protein
VHCAEGALAPLRPCSDALRRDKGETYLKLRTTPFNCLELDCVCNLNPTACARIAACAPSVLRGHASSVGELRVVPSPQVTVPATDTLCKQRGVCAFAKALCRVPPSLEVGPRCPRPPLWLPF